MTVKQFQQYCESYQYSKESFLLLKECLEYDLAQSYLEGMKFSRMIGKSDSIVFDASYLIESTDESIALFEAEQQEKKKGIFSKIGRLIKGLCQRFSRFLDKWLRSEEGLDVKGFFGDVMNNSAIGEAVTRIKNVGTGIFVDGSLRLAKMQVKKAYIGIYDKVPDGMKPWVDEMVAAWPEIFQDGSDIIVFECKNYALEEKDIESIYQTLCTLKGEGGKNEAIVKNARDNLMKILTKDHPANHVGVSIKKTTVEHIKEILDKTAELSGSVLNGIETDAVTMKDMKKLIDHLTVAISTTTAMYTAAAEIRKNTLPPSAKKKGNGKNQKRSQPKSSSGNSANNATQVTVKAAKKNQSQQSNNQNNTSNP